MREMKGLTAGATGEQRANAMSPFRSMRLAITTPSELQGGATTQPPKSEPMQGTRH